MNNWLISSIAGITYCFAVANHHVDSIFPYVSAAGTFNIFQNTQNFPRWIIDNVTEILGKTSSVFAWAATEDVLLGTNAYLGQEEGNGR